MPGTLDIGFIHLNYPRNERASETSAATEYIRYIHNQGHNVVVYCPDNPDDSGEIADDLETRFLNVDPSFPRHKGEELNRKILANDDLRTHEILHCYTGRGIPGVGKISRRTETKSVVTLNAYNSICPKNNVLYFEKYPCSSRGFVKCSACTAHSNLSEFISKVSVSEGISAGNSQTNMFRDIRIANKCEHNLDYIDAFHVYGDHARSIYSDFGYPTEKFYKIPIPKNNIFDSDMSTRPPDEFKALYVGRLSRDKGVDKLPDIIRILHEHYRHNIELTVVGEGGDLDGNIQNEFTSRNLDNYVNFKGYIKNHNLPSVYDSHHIFLYPGRVREAFGRVFLEALASSTPVISSDVGIADEILGPGGVIVNGQPKEFAREISRLINNKEKYTQMAERGNKKANEYDINKLGPAIEELYETILPN